jgi:hypothetical protein
MQCSCHRFHAAHAPVRLRLRASPAGRFILVSESVHLGRAADIKMRHVRLGEGSTQRANAFIAHLADMQVPAAEARCLVQNSGACHCCCQDALVNASRRPFPRARQRFPPVLAAL